MLLNILGFITGLAPALINLGNNITDLQKAKVKSQSDTEIAKINSRIEELHDKRQVLVAEAGSRLNVFARFLLTLMIVPPLAKIFIWDKTIGPFYGCVGRIPTPGCEAFNTDSLSMELWSIILAIIGFHFLTTWNRK